MRRDAHHPSRPLVPVASDYKLAAVFVTATDIAQPECTHRRPLLNPYILILAFFTLAGLVMAGWGWRNMMEARKFRQWSTTEGVIETSTPTSAHDDLLPHIEFSYEVAGRRYTRALEFRSGVNPSQELARSYVAKFPAGAKVRVHYDPAQPARATIEHKSSHDDWLIFAIGLGAALFGLGALLFSG